MKRYETLCWINFSNTACTAYWYWQGDCPRRFLATLCAVKNFKRCRFSQHADADADAVAAEAEAVDECLASEAADTVNFFAGRSLLGTVAEGAGVGA